jgi:hypothetical protein
MEVFSAVCAKQKRAQMLPPSFRSRESAYDKFLFLMHLDLEPFPGGAFFVKRIIVLGYYSLESLALGNAIGGKAVLR